MNTENRPTQVNENTIYETLREPDEIRVLKLNSGTSPSQIDCELIVTRLRSQNARFGNIIEDDKAAGGDAGVESDHVNGSASCSYQDRWTQTVDLPQSRLIPYEAVSWSWGKGDETRMINIKKDGKAYDFKVSLHLWEAMQALRLEKEDRYLWIDAICINQDEIKERNAQVPKMDRVYGQAINVCVWIGAGNKESDRALAFIEEKVLKLWDFDELCKDKTQTASWAAFINLMRRDWFSRRWCVQEIALAVRGTLYCGKKHIDWQKFADAVSLFVHVESATHLLSDVMRRDEFFHNLPDYFGDVSALGAALLVDATRNLFRRTKDGSLHTLMSLEHLISKYSVFESSQPRDTVYAFLAIAKDTKAQTSREAVLGSQDKEAKRIQQTLDEHPKVREILKTWGRRMNTIESYEVDYALPVEVVYKDFIFFSIMKSMKTDPTRPLDIICRPWAPPVRPGDDRSGLSYPVGGGAARFVQKTSTGEDIPRPLPSWIPSRDRAPMAMIDSPYRGSHMERRNADSLTGLPAPVGERTYQAAGSQVLDISKLKFKERQNRFAMRVKGFVLDEVGELADIANLGTVPVSWPRFAGWNRSSEDLPEDFWRTLVADRGPHGLNPPSFYPRACKEALATIFQGVPLDTRRVIDEGRCTIVAEFLRRVQGVIWNRRLMRSKRDLHLGLVAGEAIIGDVICILYGCSVPVLLRRVEKEPQAKEADILADQREAANLIGENWKRRQKLREMLERTASAEEAANAEKKVHRARSRTSVRGQARRTIPTRQNANGVSEQESQENAARQSDAGSQVKYSDDGDVFNGATDHTMSQDMHDAQEDFKPIATGDDSLHDHDTDSVGLGAHLADIAPSQSLDLSLEQTNKTGENDHTASSPKKQMGYSGIMSSLSIQPVEGPPRTPTTQSEALFLQSPTTESKKKRKMAQLIRQGEAEYKKSMEKALKKPEYYYTLVGECYVHRMMDGEAIDWQVEPVKDMDERNRRKELPMIFELR